MKKQEPFDDNLLLMELGNIIITIIFRNNIVDTYFDVRNLKKVWLSKVPKFTLPGRNVKE